jgi:hypothetical protein
MAPRSGTAGALAKRGGLDGPIRAATDVLVAEITADTEVRAVTA